MDRIVLGVYDGPSGGAALVREGRLLAIAEEDRLLRRHRVSGLPRASVQTVLRETGIAGETVSAVVIATRSATYSEGVGGSARLPLLYRVGTAVPSPPAVGRRIRETFARARRRRVDEALRSEFGISCPVTFEDHHRMHALTAAALTGCPDCLAITLDSGADGVWVQVTSVDRGQPRSVAFQTGGASLLGFLNVVCDLIGIAEGLDAYGRLQSLAVRGAPSHVDRLSPYLDWEDGRIHLHETLFRRGGALSALAETVRREDVAASALRFAGDAVRRFAEHWFAKTSHDRLVLGGDFFELATMVRAVRTSKTLPAAYVPAAPGDVGLPVGCAFAGCLAEVLEEPMPFPSEPLANPFLGISFEDEDVEETLQFESAEYTRYDDIESNVARVLAEGRSVARFHGKTEIGNRGLGNRAVLRSPRGELRRGRLGFLVNPGAYHALVLEESFGDWFQDPGISPSRFASAPGLVTPNDRFVHECPDLIGWNGEVRVQTVSANASPRLHGILKECETWSGIPILAAAPFRLPDEPLVSSPRDALRTFRLLGADYAAIGRFLIRNPEPQTSSSSAPPADEIRQ